MKLGVAARWVMPAVVAAPLVWSGLISWRVECELDAVRGLEAQGALGYRAPLSIPAWFPGGGDSTPGWGQVDSMQWIAGSADPTRDVEPNLAPLARLTSLRELLLDGLKLAHVEDWRHVTNLPRLRRLQLRRMRVPNTVLVELERCGSVEELQLFDCRLEPGALNSLSGLGGLRRLELDFSDVPLEDLPLLGRLPRLQTLSLTGLNLHDSQVNELQELLPGTAISDD